MTVSEGLRPSGSPAGTPGSCTSDFYVAQWESEELVPEFLAGRDAATDPNWAASGAESAAEYARWAHHLCGVACLRMALAALGRPVPSVHALRREVQALGAYVEEADGVIRGLIYQGAVEWLTARGIPARIALDEPTADIPAKLAAGALYIASVHATIRTPDVTPPHRGGHLVLVFGQDGEGRLRFHNPSGHTEATRRDARLPLADFARYHAERGIVIAP
ncbi:MAG: hypothetical protein K2X11_10650 [Acetobacteraceae bacterium]|nr:hypothetical protein [Acetobacteraceae bacterium]